MEAATTPETEAADTPLVPPEAPDVPTETSPAEKRSTAELFKYSEEVHVGPGAEECEHARDGECDNGMHFHAWCRLPNPFQHKEIQEKGNAAKARRMRQFRDPESDAAVILDGGLEEVEAALGENAAREVYVDELVAKDTMQDYFAVMEQMQHDEDDDKWETINEDKTRLAVLEQMTEEDRDADEYGELRSHVHEYNEEVQRLVKERQAPLRESLQDKSMDDLRSLVRAQRITVAGGEAYMNTYTVWEQYIGTLRFRKKGLPVDRYFGSIEHLKAAAPEVVEAIDQIFTQLDGEFGRSLNLGSVGKGS